MKLGVCTSPENISLAAAAGFDYAECALNAIAAMDEESFTALLQAKSSFPIPLTKCNCLLPGDISVVGPDVSREQICTYLDLAFSRAERLGINLVVFGSGRSRTCPDGFSVSVAMQQIKEFLHLLASYADRYSIDIAIEPLRPQESNLINLVSDAADLAAAVNHPRIGALGDTFHMLVSNEPWASLTHAGNQLWHMHISHTLPDLSGRIYPCSGDGENYLEVIQVLKNMNYPGDISVEAGTSNFQADCLAAVHLLKPMLG